MIRSEDQRLRAGDVIIRINSTCVAVESSLHDAVWLLVPGTTCVVDDVRHHTDSVEVPDVELVGFDSDQDVASLERGTCTVQYTDDKLPDQVCIILLIRENPQETKRAT